MPSRNNKYDITISLKTPDNPNVVLLDEQIPYAGSASFTDHLLITNSSINIECKRTSKTDLNIILKNNNSSIYNQITKSLLVYYSLCKKHVVISKLKIERSATKGILENLERNESEITQLLTPGYNLVHNISISTITDILKESATTSLLRNSLSHYLVANSKTNDIQKFEKMWRSFNALFKAKTGEGSDAGGLGVVRTMVMNDRTKLTCSNPISQSITYQNLTKLSWRKMILNDYSRKPSVANFITLVTSYKDQRILKCFKDRYFGIYKDKLSAQQTATLDAHIANHSSSTDDIELTLFLVTKYSYFLRNKNFHGDKIDSEFRITDNKEDQEFTLINIILDAFIADFFNY